MFPVTKHEAEVRKMAEMLLERKTLHPDEIESFFGAEAEGTRGNAGGA